MSNTDDARVESGGDDHQPRSENDHATEEWAFYACKNCRNVIIGTKAACPACGSDGGTTGWQRVVPSIEGVTYEQQE